LNGDTEKVWEEINRLRERDIMREADMRHLGSAVERIEASVQKLVDTVPTRKDCDYNHRTNTRLAGVWWGIIQAVLTAVAVGLVLSAKGSP
jgi:hypothetical protein